MDTFWQKALRVGGVVTIVMFVIWSLWGDIIAKFSPIPSEHTTILAGMIITLLFLLASKAMDNKTQSDQNSSAYPTSNINRSVHISSGGNSGNIVTGDGNSINSNIQTHYGSGDNVAGNKTINNSVSLGSDNSGNIVTGDGNRVNEK